MKKDILEQVTYDYVKAALEDVIAIPSESLQEKKLAEYICGRLKNAGMDASVDPHGNMVAKKKSGRPGKTIYFNSHMDTVEVGNLWTKNPYGEVDGDRFYGVGVCDCQASLTGMMLAVELLSKNGVELSGEYGLTAVAREQWPCVATKGTVNLIDDGFHADMVVIGEPTNLTICRGCEGMLEVIIEVTGVPVHACNPELGVNAIEVMYEIMSEIKKIPVGTSEILNKGAINFGVIEGGSRSCVLPEKCTLKVSRFIVEGENGSQFMKQIEAILKEVKKKDERIQATAILGYDTLAGVVQDGAEVIEMLKEASREVTGETAPLTAMRAHMDADFLINKAGIPTVAFGPGDLDAYNAGAEWVNISDVVTAVKVYITAVMNLLG